MTLTPAPKPYRRHMPSRPVLATAVASVILGATFAAGAGTSSAQATTAKATTAALPISAGPWSSGPGWAEFTQAPWTPARSARTEYFHVASTAPSGPGTIIITGVVDAGGAEHPGRAIRRRDLRRRWLPHRSQCRASHCPLQPGHVRGDHQPDGTVQCPRRDRPVLRPRRQRHIRVPRPLHHRSGRQRLYRRHDWLHREHRGGNRHYGGWPAVVGVVPRYEPVEQVEDGTEPKALPHHLDAARRAAPARRRPCGGPPTRRRQWIRARWRRTPSRTARTGWSGEGSRTYATRAAKAVTSRTRMRAGQ
jgi:hypothetical protein